MKAFVYTVYVKGFDSPKCLNHKTNIHVSTLQIKGFRQGSKHPPPPPAFYQVSLTTDTSFLQVGESKVFAQEHSTLTKLGPEQPRVQRTNH